MIPHLTLIFQNDGRFMTNIYDEARICLRQEEIEINMDLYTPFVTPIIGSLPSPPLETDVAHTCCAMFTQA